MTKKRPVLISKKGPQRTYLYHILKCRKKIFEKTYNKNYIGCKFFCQKLKILKNVELFVFLQDLKCLGMVCGYFSATLSFPGG